MGVPSYIPIFLAMVLSLAGGGPNDLLGYLSSDSYWKAKNVEPTVTQLTADLVPTKPTDVSKLIADLAAPDPAAREEAGKKIVAFGPGALGQLDEAAKDASDPETAARSKALAAEVRAAAHGLAVRRLMAIRTLGELKSPDALPTLRGLLESNDPFVADYAKSAIAAIEGKSALVAHPASNRMADVNLLPAKIDMVCQLSPTGGPVLPLEKIFATVPLALAMPNEDPVRVMKQMKLDFINVVEAVGNVRLDSVTLGWYTAPVGKPGHAIIIARGQFDRSAIVALLQRNQVPQKQVGNSDIYMLDETTALSFPADGMALIVAAEKEGELPIEQALSAVAKGNGTFAQNAELSKLIKSIDITQPLWMATRVRDIRELFDFLAPFDTATLVASAAKDASQPTVNVTVTAAGADAQAVKAGAETAQAELKQGLDEAANEAKMVPMMKPLADAARTVKVTADDKTARASGTITLDALLPFIMNSGVRIEMNANPPAH